MRKNYVTFKIKSNQAAIIINEDGSANRIYLPDSATEDEQAKPNMILITLFAYLTHENNEKLLNDLIDTMLKVP